ncbi:hypothetical protein M9434_006811 [Picochlorum sp. BPE23]|nr:hypothetical protein M9434_006811 [Picochlorum sp. BPE23]
MHTDIQAARRKRAMSGYSSDSPVSDEEENESDYRKGGYHPVYIGETFKNGRYTVLHKLGWGHFSTVWLVADEVKGGQAALKVVKSAEHYSAAAKDEVDILSHVVEKDPENAYHCCRMIDTFEHRGPHGKHVCMVFEVLGDNLLSLIRHYDHEGIPLDIVKHLCRQILEGLDFLHRVCGVIHTDLKPENVMLKKPLKKSQEESIASSIQSFTRDSDAWKNQNKGKIARALAAGKPLTKNQKKKLRKKQQKANVEKTLSPHAEPALENKMEKPESNKIDELNGELEDFHLSLEERLRTMECKIVDFGNACWVHKHFTQEIQTRQYRSPEVILGAKYDASADMWSMACLIFELVTGDFLFEPKSGKYFSRDDDHLAQMIELLGHMPRSVSLSGKHSRDFFNREGKLRHIDRLKFWPLKQVLVDKYRLEPKEAELLEDFLLPMLDFVPSKRVTAGQCLSHQWLKSSKKEDITHD